MGKKGAVSCPSRVDTRATCAGTNPACTSGGAVSHCSVGGRGPSLVLLGLSGGTTLKPTDE